MYQQEDCRDQSLSEGLRLEAAPKTRTAEPEGVE